ncbi:hypothetical protein AB0I81_00825 [Nonomuraea sp. NPDC050404]|uniref:hypothetical protein n=1 Tax=Nonomuraea sp. NPDC050404 TaxID=3155783 RepID=UPI0033F2AACB
MNLMIVGVLASMAGGLLTLLTTWVRERHRQGRVTAVLPHLPCGSVYIDGVTGVRIETGSPAKPSSAETREE